jgi:hypothetical protein
MGTEDFEWGHAAEHIRYMNPGSDEVIDIQARLEIAVLKSQHEEFLRSLGGIQGTLNNIFVAMLGGIVTVGAGVVLAVITHHV